MNGILWIEGHRHHQNRQVIYDVSVKRRVLRRIKEEFVADRLSIIISSIMNIL